jgi:hypothetical protein
MRKHEHKRKHKAARKAGSGSISGRIVGQNSCTKQFPGDEQRPDQCLSVATLAMIC